MEAQKYQSANLRPGNVDTQMAGTTTAINVATNEIASLQDRLKSFSADAYKMAEIQAVDNAKKQAAQDDIEKKPFHEESVRTLYGRAYNETRSASYAANSEIAIAEQSTKFALEAKGDPDVYASSMKDFVDSLSAKAPTPELQSVIGISGKKVMNSQYGKLQIEKAAQLKLGRIQEFEQSRKLNEARLINAIADGDNATADLIKEGMLTYATTMLFNDDLTEDELAKYSKESIHAVDKGVQERKMQDLLDDGKFKEAQAMINDEIPEGKTYKEHNEIQTSLKRIISTKAKEQTANIAKVKEAAKIKAKNEIEVLKSGQTPKNTVAPDEFNTLSTADKNNLVIARDVARIYNTIEVDQNGQPRTLSQLSNIVMNGVVDQNGNVVIPGETTTGKETVVSVRVFEALKKTLKDRTAAWTNDPMTQGEIEGNYKLTVPLDPNNVAPFLKERMDAATANKSTIGLGGNTLLKKSEVETISQFIEGADDKQKLALAKQISSQGIDVAQKVFNQLIKSDKTAGTFAFAGTLANQGKRAVANAMLKGHNADVTLPEGYKAEIDTEIKGILPRANQTEYNAVKRGIEDYMKGLAITGEDVSVDDVDSYVEAIMGEMPNINGRKTIMPPGMARGVFIEKLDNYVVPNDPYATKIINDMTDIFGNNAQLHYISPGEYAVYHTDDQGISDYIKDKNNPGKALIVKISK